MTRAIDRGARAAAVLGLAGALLMCPAILNASGALAGDSGYVQLAQAKRAAPQQRAPAQPAAPPSQAAETEQQLSALQKELKITPQQQSQFDAFAQVMRQNAQATDAAVQQAQQGQTHNAVEDLRTFAKMTQTQAEGLQRLIPAFEALYNSLSDPQKRTADQVFGQGAQSGEPPQQGARPRS